MAAERAMLEAVAREDAGRAAEAAARKEAARAAARQTAAQLQEQVRAWCVLAVSCCT